MLLDENSKLKRERPGLTADVACYTGSGVTISVHYRRKGESEQTGMIASANGDESYRFEKKVGV